MTLPSKAAMELTRLVQSHLMGGPLVDEDLEVVALLIDAHPMVKGLLDGATDDNYHNGDLLEAPKCSICQAVRAWQPQTEQEK